MGAIKGVGRAVIDALIAERDAHTVEYKDIACVRCCRRIDARASVNRRDDSRR